MSTWAGLGGGFEVGISQAGDIHDHADHRALLHPTLGQRRHGSVRSLELLHHCGGESVVVRSARWAERQDSVLRRCCP